VAVLAVLAIAVSLFIRWLGGAKALGSGIGYGLGGPARVGETVYSGPMVFSASGSVATVDIRSITPRVIHDSAGAQIRTLVCERNSTTFPVGGVLARTSYSWCRPFHLGVVTVGPDDAADGQISVILAVTARHGGSVDIDGVHVDYRQGVRHGSATSGMELQLWTGKTDPFDN
jgi:hypothetical protein